jgi:hypothetical protein
MAQTSLREMVEAERSHREQLVELRRERARQWATQYSTLWAEVQRLDSEAVEAGYGRVKANAGSIKCEAGREALAGEIVVSRPSDAEGCGTIVAQFSIKDEARMMALSVRPSHLFEDYDPLTVSDAFPKLRNSVAGVLV